MAVPQEFDQVRMRKSSKKAHLGVHKQMKWNSHKNLGKFLADTRKKKKKTHRPRAMEQFSRLNIWKIPGLVNDQLKLS